MIVKHKKEEKEFIRKDKKNKVLLIFKNIKARIYVKREKTLIVIIQKE